MKHFVTREVPWTGVLLSSGALFVNDQGDRSCFISHESNSKSFVDLSTSAACHRGIALILKV